MRLALFRRPVVSLLVVSAGLCMTEVASAQSVTDKSSTATAPLIWKTRDNFYGIGTELGNSKVDVKVGFSFNAEDDTNKDLLRVDMSKGALIEASWGDGATMSLKSTGSNNKEGFLKAEYQLAPTVDLTVDASSIPLVGQVYNYTWDANTLLNSALPGANFQYHAANQANFEPWGWQGAKFSIPGAALASSKLVSVGFDQIIGSNSPLVGDIAINLTTTPTFTYKTTSIQLDNNKPIKADGEETQIAAVDTDYLEVNALVKGQIDYSGTMDVRPTVSVTEIDVGGVAVPVNISFDLNSVAGAHLEYGSTQQPGAPIAVDFPKTVFHIPLPNVKVRQRSLDMGTSTLGQELKKTVQIDNTGEMGAVLEFESTDPQFKVTKATKIASKGKYDLEVQFVPNNAGPAAAKITVKSNDPNEPKVEINVTANGAEPPAPPATTHSADPTPVASPGSDSGCGCVTAGAHAPNTALGLGGFALGLAALVSRRRNRG